MEIKQNLLLQIFYDDEAEADEDDDNDEVGDYNVVQEISFASLSS